MDILKNNGWNSKMWKDTFARQLWNQVNETLNVIYKQTAFKWLKIASSIGVSYLLTQKFIVSILMHDTFIIMSWWKIVTFYFIVFLLAFIIYILTEVFLKFLLYVFR